MQRATCLLEEPVHSWKEGSIKKAKKKGKNEASNKGADVEGISVCSYSRPGSVEAEKRYETK